MKRRSVPIHPERSPMSQLSNACLIAGLAIAGGAPRRRPRRPGSLRLAGGTSRAPSRSTGSERCNAKAEAEIAGTPAFKRLEADIRAILDSDAKIPGVEKIGDHYNFWKDKQHERGIWRRTTLDEYRKPEPKWKPCSTWTR